MNNKKRLQQTAAAVIIAAACVLFLWRFQDGDVRRGTSVNGQTAALLEQRASAYTSEDVYARRAQLKEEQERKAEASQPKPPVEQAPPENVQEGASQDIAARFSGSLVIGDSIAEGLLAYGVLNEAECIGVRGLRIDQLDQYIDEIARRSPAVLFLEFGMNDLEYWQGNAEQFARVYQEKLDMLISRFPQMRIYVNSVLPISQQAIAQTPANGSWSAYNASLSALCAQKGVTYIDNGSILLSLAQPFEQDGIHPRPDYYPLWAQHMADSAGL